MRLTPPRAPTSARESPRTPLPSPGGGTRIWLLRHARVAAPFEGLAYGDQDVPLSREGEAQSLALARATARLSPAAILSSPLARARRLGAACAELHGLPLRIEARFRELHRGAWQGLSIESYQARWQAQAAAYFDDCWNWRGHGGESEAQLHARCWPPFIELVTAFPGQCLLIATHRNVIRSLVAAALGLSVPQSHALRIDPATGVLLEDHPQGWRLHRSNVPEPDLAPPRLLAES